MGKDRQIEELVAPIRDDLTSGAAELALRGITVFRSLMTESANDSAAELYQLLITTAQALVKSQPAMAPIFHLSNTVLQSASDITKTDEMISRADAALDAFETRLCESAAKIADQVIELIPPGELVFAYSFSSTVVSGLLNARAQRKFFRVVCTEARPSMEGRKLASVLAQAGIEVIHTFDSAMPLILPMCRVAFMGIDCVGRPGIVNKVGSRLLGFACKNLEIPLYALAGTEKFVTDDQFFEFEDHERPGSEVWTDPPPGVKILNKQFEPIPFSDITGIVSEHGILHEKDVDKYVSSINVHEALRGHGAFV